MKGLVTGLLVALLCWTAPAGAADLNGTFVTPGDKGPVTLTLKETPEGISGSISGGTLKANLTGFKSPDGTYLGVATSEAGEVLSYFGVSGSDTVIHFDLMGANAEGDPDRANARRVTFPREKTTATPPKPSLERAQALAGAKPKPTGSPTRATAGKPAAAPQPQAKAGTPGKTPSPPGAAAALPARSSAQGTGDGLWKSYVHATGLKMNYPAAWKAQQGEGFLQLVPPDQATGPAGAREVYLVSADGAEGVTDINDQRVAPYLDQQLSQLAPFLQRTQAPQPVKAGTAPGILCSYEGTNPQGKLIKAEIYAAILKGYAVALVSLGEGPLIQKRSDTMRAMFASFGTGAGQKDPQLVGQWKFWSYKSSADGKFGTETTRYFTLRQDGTCNWSSQAESSGSFSGKDSLGNTTWTGGVAGTGGNADSGTWSASNGELFVLWGDGSTGSWNYRIAVGANGKRMFLKGSGKEADEWVPVR